MTSAYPFSYAPPAGMLTTNSVFVLRTDCELAEELVSFVRLLLLPKDEWEKVAQKSKLPKPKLDKDVLTIAVDVLEKRLKDYPTTLEVRPCVLSASFRFAWS